MARKTVQGNEFEQQIVDSVADLDKSLKKIANCLGLIAVRMSRKECHTKKDRILLLKRLDFAKEAIAAIVDTSPEHVRVVISKAKAANKDEKAQGEGS